MHLKIVILLLFSISCVKEESISPNNTFEFSDIQITVDKLNNELFIQTFINYFENTDSIETVTVQLNSYFNGSYHSIGEYELNDDGENGDFIKNNGRFSTLTTAENLDFTDVEPEIKSINMGNSFQLSESELTYLNIEVIVSGKPIRADFTAIDVWGNVATYSEYSNVSNNYIEIQVDTDSMYKDIFPDDDELCERETGFTNNGLAYYFNIFENQRYNNGNYFLYSTEIPFRPINECGGTGEVLFSFLLHDLDFGNCVSSDLQDCNLNIMDMEEFTLWVYGCGDGICMTDFENSISCNEDCQ